jgi:hypothetical protein
MSVHAMAGSRRVHLYIAAPSAVGLRHVIAALRHRGLGAGGMTGVASAGLPTVQFAQAPVSGVATSILFLLGLFGAPGIILMTTRIGTLDARHRPAYGSPQAEGGKWPREVRRDRPGVARARAAPQRDPVRWARRRHDPCAPLTGRRVRGLHVPAGPRSALARGDPTVLVTLGLAMLLGGLSGRLVAPVSGASLVLPSVGCRHPVL